MPAAAQAGTYVALLRGINVGGRNPVPMQGLRDLAAGLGCEGVQTYIQSGNLVLRSREDEEGLRFGLEEALLRRYGRAIAVAVRTAEEIEEALLRCPFAQEGFHTVSIGFLVASPDEPGAAAAWQGMPGSEDRFAFLGRHLFIGYRDGVHGSPLTNALFERRLGVAITSRNLATVRRLAVLARSEG